MKTTAFQREWIEISEHLGLDIRLSYEIELGDRRLVVPVLLEGYGAEKGMVLLTDYDLIKDVTKELVRPGYGYSCLSEPLPGPIGWSGVENMLRDWGAVI